MPITKSNTLRIILLAVVVLVCYFPSLQGSFIWDDIDYVQNNKTLHSLEGLKNIWIEPRATPNYYPLLFTTFWLEYQLWQDNSTGYHLVNIFFHITNALLIWYLLGRLKIDGAYVIAFIFAAHPVHVESVAWIAELKNTQSTFFMLLSVVFFLTHLRTAGGSPKPRPFFNTKLMVYALSLLAFYAALLTKPVACVLPGILFVVLWLDGTSIRRRHFLLIAPYILIGVFFMLFIIIVEHHYLLLSRTTLSFSVLERILIAGKAFWFYPLKIVWPAPLMFIYPRWTINTADPAAYLYPLSVLVMFVLLVLSRGKVRKGALAAFLYYGLTVAPVLGLIDYQNLRYTFVADHFQYLPSIGIIALAVNGIRITMKDALFKKILAVIIIFFAGLSWRHAAHFQSRISIYSDTIAKNPNSPFPYNLRGRAFFEEGSYDLALVDFSRAASIKPDYYQAYYNRAFVHLKRGDNDSARDDFRRAAQLTRQ